MRWLPGQLAFLMDPSKKKMARWGNQAMGKTTAGLRAIDWRCTGRHPFIQVPRPPIEAWIICASWSQSITIQKKFWQTIDRRDVVAGTTFDEKNGFGAKSPMVQYLNGSVVRFKTTKQGALNLSGATIDVALFDEPPASQRIYGEVSKRVMKRNGSILLSLTPINADVGWLKKIVDAGGISDHWYRLEPQNLIPVGYDQPIRLTDGTLCDADWIAQIIAETIPHEVPVVCHGEWELRLKGNVFRAFRHLGDDPHVVEYMPADQLQRTVRETPQGGQVVDLDVFERDVERLEGEGWSIEWRLGIDHGSGWSFSSVAVLGAALVHNGEVKQLWAVDEYVSDGETTDDQDALGIASMLIRNDLKWRDLKRVYGDRPWASKGAARINQKSNAKLMKALQRLPKHIRDRAGITKHGMLPKIATVKRGEGHGAGSVRIGIEFLHKAMVRPNAFRIHVSCVRGVKSLFNWEGRTTSQWKHWIDCFRYAFDDLIFDRRVPVGVEVVIG